MKVALVCVAKWEDYYLDEWLDYNHKIGFDKIIMYQNDWRTDIERPFLEKREFDGRAIQLAVYNSFLDTDNEYDWVAFFDCDEFLILKKHNNVKEFIEEYGNHPVLSFNWYMFGSCGLETRTSNSLIKMFQNRNKNPDQHVKVMVKRDSNNRLQLPHNCYGSAMDTNGNKFLGPFNPNGPMNVAYLNHYHNKTREDWMLRCKRGRVDCDVLHDQNRWDNEVNDNIDIVDLFAYNFMYGN